MVNMILSDGEKVISKAGIAKGVTDREKITFLLQAFRDDVAIFKEFVQTDVARYWFTEKGSLSRIMKRQPRLKKEDR